MGISARRLLWLSLSIGKSKTFFPQSSQFSFLSKLPTSKEFSYISNRNHYNCFIVGSFITDLLLEVQFSRTIMYDCVTPWTATHQASLSITNSQSLLKLMSVESVMPSNHLILRHPLLEVSCSKNCWRGWSRRPRWYLCNSSQNSPPELSQQGRWLQEVESEADELKHPHGNGYSWMQGSGICHHQHSCCLLIPTRLVTKRWRAAAEPTVSTQPCSRHVPGLLWARPWGQTSWNAWFLGRFLR